MVAILDSTLREGEQTLGVKFTLEEKVHIAKELDKFGVEYIEAGMPIISGYDFQCVKAVAQLGLNAKVLGHARAKKEDIDAVRDSGCSWVGIFCGINELSRQFKLGGKSKQETYDMIQEAIRHAKNNGLHVRFTVEDATRTPIDELLNVASLAKKAGADRFGVADTVGCATPEEISELFSTLNNIGIDLEFHGHNDLGLATANSIAAYRAGASVIDTAVNGLGERAGITSLAELALVLKLKYHQNDKNYSMLTELSNLVVTYSGIFPDSLRPVLGNHVFTHTARLHQIAVEQNTECYEFINPEVIGRMRGKNLPTDFSKCIGKPFIKSAEELKGHTAGQGSRYVFLDRRVIPSSNFYAAVRSVDNAVVDKQSHVCLHSHNCDSAFLFIGAKNNLEGLVCEVTLGDNNFIVESPASVFIPKNINHSYRLIGGSGYFVNIILSNDYNRSVILAPPC